MRIEIRVLDYWIGDVRRAVIEFPYPIIERGYFIIPEGFVERITSGGSVFLADSSTLVGAWEDLPKTLKDISFSCGRAEDHSPYDPLPDYLEIEV